jgi:hypothetical protein
MPTWVKVVLIIVLVGFVVLVAGVIVAARWVRSRGESLKEEGKALVAEAREFGRGKDGEACLAESFTRLKACDGFICEAKVKIFLQGCLETATVSPEFCAGVPPPSEIMKTVRYQLAECERRGMANSKPCTRLMGGVQAYCASR